MRTADIKSFQDRIRLFYRQNGRDLAWRHNASPYEVFVSEIMLQQTQVSRVQTRYPLWLEQFPGFEVLAATSTQDVIAAWQGMGYNRRALWLKAAATMVVRDYDGELPREPAELLKLPGVGVNTAGSMAAFAYNLPVVFIETNIRRVYLHEFFADKEGIEDRQLMPYIDATLDLTHPREWYYALMDYGADLAKRIPNPNRRSRHYTVQSKFEGSSRQIRGEVLRLLVAGEKRVSELGISDERLPDVVKSLVQEGFLSQRGDLLALSK